MATLKPRVLAAGFGAFFAIIAIVSWQFAQGLPGPWFAADFTRWIYSTYMIVAAVFLMGIAGLGLSILSEMAVQADHRVLTAKDGFAPIDKTELALIAAADASPATLRLADRLAEFCDTVQAKAA